ncbi:hypothetical protein [Pseudoalteromonas fuliginea]|uniref:Uncharacterized protein n=1 Tax=Pseudoalteromonas fuliginea TaxID=1872678 RepID=A0ABQ6RNK7_9GAMM|nr:hypothetical protein [Pseudoalteromonas fuliginea]KAA1166618.1 hypothetical protein EU509_00330 [Pseudoalteromonas fuliginea]KAA1170029.1 hypothetical protein EUZ79_00280 [Pseudoalteromonas fuliginea]
MFFEDANNRAVLEGTLNKYWDNEDRLQFKNDFNIDDNNFSLFVDSLSIIKEIYNQPKTWDEFTLVHTQLSTKLIENCKYFNSLDSYFDTVLENSIEVIYLCCIRLFYEVDFRRNEELVYSTLFIEQSLEKIRVNAADNSKNEYPSSNFRKKVNDIIFSVPYDILKSLFNSEEIKLLSEFDKKNEIANYTFGKIDSYADTITERINKFNNELSEKEQTVNSLKETLDKQETAFNFVGLYDGFNKLLKTKILESRILLGSLVTMGIIMIVPLLCTIFGWLPENILKDEEAISHLLKLVPFISLEVLLIYFFRVILQNYKSVKAQILQIELRQTLCQFIQNYADYSKEIKKDDPTVLEKFENLIFSGIISDAENLPSTFDGMDQIGKLFSTLKGKG